MTRLALAVVLLGTLAVGVAGIQRSLWLDEAWVANSIRGEGEWLQTSPPLFLLVARASVALFGLSTPALRAVPLAFALLAVGATFLVVRRVAGGSWAVFAAGMMGLSSSTVEYLHAFKQYAGEIAAAAVVLFAAVTYLQSPERRRFVWLVTAIVVAMPLAYSTAFVAPGVIVAVALLGELGRAAILGAISVVELAALYWWFIAPNVAPSLWTYWQEGSAYATGIGAWYALLFALLMTVHVALRLMRGHRTWQEATQIAALLPYLLLLTAELAGWYPASPRTRLFVHPCMALLIATLCRPGAWPRGLPVAAILLALGSTYTQIRTLAPFEDYATAVDYLRSLASPNDRLIVHASAREGFRLYAAMSGWQAPAQYGDTGWPCCRIAGNAPPHSATAQDVDRDLARLVPAGYTGRVWLLYTTRPTHWIYNGLDEGNLWRSHLWKRGCPPGPYIALPNLAISRMDCVFAKSP